MNDFQHLRERLITLAGPSEPRSGHTRMLDITVSGGAYSAFEAEISQTRLPRQLSFQNSAGLRIVFTAAGGRILSLDAASMPGKTEKTLPVSLTEEAPEAVSLASVLLSRLLDETDSLGVEVALNPFAQDGLGLGVKACLLRPRAEPLDQTPPPFEVFLRHIQANCAAWIVLRAGQIAELEGEAAYQSRLKDLSETLDVPEQDDASDLHCVMLTPRRSTQMILCASASQKLAFAILPNTALASMFDGWRKLQHTNDL